MNARLRWVWAGLAVLAMSCGPHGLKPDAGVDLGDGGVADLGDGGAKCTAELEDLMRNALAVAPADESFVFELRRDSDGRVFRAYRTVSGKAPLNEATMLQSASTAKLVSAVVILDVITNPSSYPGGGLVNGQPLTLDSPIKDFLPTTGGGTAWGPTVGTLPSNSRLQTVTLRHLLSFTSGLSKEPACISSLTDPDTCVRAIVDANLTGNADGTAPRTLYYSGAHLFVAARAAVNASGLSDWGALFRRFKETHQVFQTALETPGGAQFGVGAFYPASGPGNSPSPAGALRYTAGDYTPFLMKLLHHEILSAATVSQLFTDETARQNASIEYSPLLDDGEAWHYNLGNWTECPMATFEPGCATLRRYSSPGSFGTYPFIDFNPTSSGDAPFVGLIGWGGSTQGVAAHSIAVYRTLGNGDALTTKDLAQQWAAATCP